MPYAIVMPCGSGKTPLSEKYPNLYDVDKFSVPEHVDEMIASCAQAVKDGNWDRHERLEYTFIHHKIAKLPAHAVVLMHSYSKAALYGLKVLGSLKVSKPLLERELKKRAREKGEWLVNATKLNWAQITNAKICHSFDEMERSLVALANNAKTLEKDRQEGESKVGEHSKAPDKHDVESTSPVANS